MNKIDNRLLVNTSRGFDSEDALVQFIYSGEPDKRAGLIFEMSQPHLLQVVIRFYSRGISVHPEPWLSPRIGITDRDLSDGGDDEPKYYGRGFVRLQHAVFEALYGTGNRTIKINRMPVKSSLEDKFICRLFQVTWYFLYIFLMSFLNSVMVSSFII